MALGMDINFTRDPIVVFGAESASFWKSMALAIMYGLGVATLLTLFVVPALYSLIEGGKEWFGRLFKRKPKSAPEPVEAEEATAASKASDVATENEQLHNRTVQRAVAAAKRVLAYKSHDASSTPEVVGASVDDWSLTHIDGKTFSA